MTSTFNCWGIMLPPLSSLSASHLTWQEALLCRICRVDTKLLLMNISVSKKKIIIIMFSWESVRVRMCMCTIAYEPLHGLFVFPSTYLHTCLLFIWDKVCLCLPDWPQTPVSASRVQRSQHDSSHLACNILSFFFFFFLWCFKAGLELTEIDLPQPPKFWD